MNARGIGWWGVGIVVVFVIGSANVHAGIYRNMILSDDPVAYWGLGESNAAQTAVNLATGPSSAGAAANGTYTAGLSVGNPGLLTGDPDTAITTIGNERMATAGFEKFSGGSGFSVEFWTKANALPTSLWTNLVGDGEGGGDFNLMLYMGDTGKLRAHVNTNTGVSATDTTAAPLVGQRHHVVSTWDSATGSLNLYVDGLQAAPTVTRTGSLINTNNPIFIGDDNREPGSPAAGIVFDDVAIYKRPLSQADIFRHLHAGRGSPMSVNLSTDVLGPGHYGNGYTNTNTVEVVRFVANSDASPLDVAYTRQPSPTIDLSPWVVSGPTAGDLGSDVHGRGGNLWLPGDGEINEFHAGLGAHANWLITYDLQDIRWQHLGGTDWPLMLTGRVGVNGNVAAPSPPNAIIQGGIWLDGQLIDMSPLLNLGSPSHAFSLRLPSDAQYLTFALLNGDGSTAWDDIAFRDLVLTAVPEPSTVALLGMGLLGLVFLRRRSLGMR